MFPVRIAHGLALFGVSALTASPVDSVAGQTVELFLSLILSSGSSAHLSTNPSFFFAGYALVERDNLFWQFVMEHLDS